METSQTLNQKQYFVLKEVKIDAFHILRPNTVVMLDPEIAEPLISANLLCPLLSAIKQGLYPLKKEENAISSAIKSVKNAIAETEKGISDSLAQSSEKSRQESPLVSSLKASTKQRSNRSIAFENDLKKKIQEKKKAAKQSST